MDPAFGAMYYGCCNSYVLAYDFSDEQFRTVCRKAWYRQIYMPQLRFDDCDRFEMVYTNPLPSSTKLVIQTLDRANNTVTQISRRLSSLETVAIEFDNESRGHVTIRHESNVFEWRPLIFKYYDSHFDVLHS